MKRRDLGGLVPDWIERMWAAKPVGKSTTGWVRRIFDANGFHFGKGQNFSVLLADEIGGESRFASFGKVGV
jgi:hypothetical protein